MKKCGTIRLALRLDGRPRTSAPTTLQNKTAKTALLASSLLLLTFPSLAAGSATASDVALKGGMSLIDGTWISQMMSGIAAIIGAVGGIVATLMWGKHKAGKAQRPLDSDDRFVTQLECRNHRCALEKRIDELGPALERIFKKLTDNDKRSEERANQMHRRVDPLIEKLSETRGEVSALKDRIRDASARSTVGGGK